ncbi:MAG: cytochrome c biogenesis heme-transporting ATPase CcmA [Pseudomonadota bacterium]
MTALLTLQGLGCSRGGRPLFSGLDLSVKPGWLVRVQGANGAGKTSLLRLLCGLLLPSEGQVCWRGEPLSAQRETLGRERVYLGHAAAMKDGLSLLENLEFACQLAGSSASRADCVLALDEAGLQGYEHTLAKRLSEGQRRRAALARLKLSSHAPLWILDEPFNALDAPAVRWVEGLVDKHLQRSGIVVLTSHQGLPLPDAMAQVVSL